MKRLLLACAANLTWCHWWMALLGAVRCSAVAALIAAVCGLHPPLVILAALLGAIYPFHRWGAYAWRFSRSTRRFLTLSRGDATLHYAPELAERLDLATHLQQWREAREAISKQFGGSLKRPLAIFLFPTMAEISRFFGREMAACALPRADAVILAADSLLVFEEPAELMRHEVAHLFAAYWGSHNPAFKGEGLATWLQGSIHGRPIDYRVLVALLGNQCLPLAWLQEPPVFDAGHFHSYALAGSFTGFLIRRFGPERYREFFRDAEAGSLVGVFEGSFGVSLQAAEREWREELLLQRDAFEPHLSIALREQRLEAAHSGWQPFPCIEECEALVREGKASARILGIAAAAHTRLANYDQAIALLEQVASQDDPRLPVYRSRLSLALGRLHDLRGQRDQALQHYRHSLGEPDGWDRRDGSCHAQARRYLKRPYTERELLASFERQRRREVLAPTRGDTFLQS